MKSLYISDLDGTLLHSDQTFSEYETEKLIEFNKKGILFTVATARSMITGKMLLGGIPFSVPTVLMNGVFIYDMAKKHVIKYFAIEKEAYKRVLTVFEDSGLHPNIFTFDGEKLSIRCTGIDTKAMQWFFDTRKEMLDGRFYEVESLETLPKGESPVYFNFFAPKEMLDCVFEKLKDVEGVNVAYYSDQYTGGWLMEIFSDTASKSGAMKFIKEYVGADETVAFGDNLNDIPMLKAADRSVAVENAVDEVKKIADIIIGTNNNDSVVKFIAKENGIEI